MYVPNAFLPTSPWRLYVLKDEISYTNCSPGSTRGLESPSPETNVGLQRFGSLSENAGEDLLAEMSWGMVGWALVSQSQSPTDMARQTKSILKHVEVDSSSNKL